MVCVNVQAAGGIQLPASACLMASLLSVPFLSFQDGRWPDAVRLQRGPERHCAAAHPFSCRPPGQSRPEGPRSRRVQLSIAGCRHPRQQRGQVVQPVARQSAVNLKPLFPYPPRHWSIQG